MARIISYRDALEAKEPPWTIGGVLGGLGLLWGEAGVGKSFVACSMAAAVATGRPWLGHRVPGGAVVYIAGEGGAGGTARRMQAALTALSCCDPEDEQVPLWIVTPGVDLVPGPAELLGIIGKIEPELVVVDTLARCFGGDENSTEDMSGFVRTLDMIRDLGVGSVLVIHHANKTDKSGSGKVRGSSVLYGAVDVSMQLSVDAAHKDIGKLVADKLRDRDVEGTLADFAFVQVPIHGEKDELGDDRTTRVVAQSPAFTAGLPAVAMVAINAGVITYDNWRKGCVMYRKAEFDRMVVAIIGDPEGWGIVEIAEGVFGPREGVKV